MRRERIKIIARRCWLAARVMVGWPVFVVGLSGLPGDVDTWASWIHSIMSDPRVQQLAAIAVEIADFVNQYWVRALLVIVGLAILLWGWRPFWNVRHRLWFVWRRAVTEEVWIDYDTAQKLVTNSTWARLRKPQMNSMAFSLARVFTDENSNSPFRQSQAKFRHFIRFTLKSFEKNNPDSVRTVENNKQYREGVLREFLDVALEAEVTEEFGNIPDYKVENR